MADIGMVVRPARTVAKILDRAVIAALLAVNVLAVGFILNSRFCNVKLIGILNERQTTTHVL